MPKVPKKAGAVGALSKQESRNLWKKLEKEKQYQEKLEAAKASGSSYVDDRKDPDVEEAKDEWRKLLAELKVKFPEHLADKFDLKPKQKAAALARLLGWPTEKISKASGAAKRTLQTWFKDPLVIEFQRAFEYYVGTKDGKEMLDREIYPSIEVLKDLRDSDSTPASVRRDVAVWFFEQKYGKAKEVKEIQGQNIKELTKQLMDITKGNLIQDMEDEEELEEELH